MSLPSALHPQPLTDNPRILELLPEELPSFLQFFHIVDVRGEDEFNGELGHIEGAENIELSMLPQRFAQVATDKPVLFVCKVGGRSAKATGFALQTGRSDVYSLRGGMLRWHELGFPTST